MSKDNINNHFFPLTTFGLIAIKGPDAAKFLQGQLTCNVNEVNATHAVLGAYCSQQGRVNATFHLLTFNDGYYLYLPLELVELMIGLLQKYAVFSKVTIRNASLDFKILGLIGEELVCPLQTYFTSLPELINEISSTDLACLIKLSGQACRYLLIYEQTLEQKIKSEFLKSATSDNYDQWKLLDIQAGIPTIHQQTSGEFTPHMLNYHLIGGISFNKGCYIGQEIIARTHYRGQVKQRLFRMQVTCQQEIKPGDKIVNKDQVSLGTVINSAMIQTHQFELLAVIQTSALPTQDLFIFGNPLKQLPLPYQPEINNANA